jgi:hypothetical protein
MFFVHVQATWWYESNREAHQMGGRITPLIPERSRSLHRTTTQPEGYKIFMPTSRRDIFRGALAAGPAATFPSVAGAATAMTPALKDRYAQLDAAASRPVFKRELFPQPAIIESIELLHYGKSWLRRVRTKDGAEGISVSNSQQMSVLYPIFVKRIAPFFIGKDARDIEARSGLCCQAHRGEGLTAR